MIVPNDSWEGVEGPTGIYKGEDALKRRKDTTRLKKVCNTSNNEIIMLYRHCDI